MLLVFGALARYPLAPMALAIVLGNRAEEAFRQSLLGSQGSVAVFWSNGLVGSIMALGLIALFWPLINEGWIRLRARPRGGSCEVAPQDRTWALGGRMLDEVYFPAANEENWRSDRTQAHRSGHLSQRHSSPKLGTPLSAN
jgi:hypothetical protein